MGKDRRTVSLDPEVNDYLDREGVNASQLVNKLVHNYMSAGGDDAAILRLRAQQIRSEIQEFESRMETKETELEQIEAKMSDVQDDRDDVYDNATDALTIQDVREANRKVEWWADEAGVTTENFIQEVEDRIR